MNDASLGGIGGMATQSVVTAKTGYIGQLYDLKALQLAASPLTVNENSTRQVIAALVMDDDTIQAAVGGFAWSITTGPATVDGSGLVSGQPVYQNTPATVQASAGGAMGTLNLTILNNLPDNFGTYAADGIDDGWQFQYFGLNNPNAGPMNDPDFDGQNNLFEFIAGIVPIDPLSRFSISATVVTGQPAQKNIVFSPRFADRTYTVTTSTMLGTGAVWTPLGTFSSNDDGTIRAVTDTNATGPRKFYRVEISKP